jgi:response regulator of citrate/malate metabolism
VAAKYRVLVVEDDEHIASMLERCISRNRALTLAGTAKAAGPAIEMAFRLSPDLVLLDFTLSTPRDGFSVWDALHKLSNAPEVIAVTAAGDVSTVEKARNWGARGYVVKPFTSEIIIGKLDEYVRRRGYATGRIKRPSQLDINIMVRDGAPPRWSGREAPRGLLRETLDSVITALRSAQGPLSAEDVASLVNVHRTTARRYLQFLVDDGVATLRVENGKPGHPTNLYALSPWWEPETPPTPT